jgi:hypothetical protein
MIRGPDPNELEEVGFFERHGGAAMCSATSGATWTGPRLLSSGFGVKPSQDDYRGLWLNIPCAVAREAS